MAKAIEVWRDETSDDHGWIVSLEDGQASDTLSVSEDQGEAEHIGKRLSSLLKANKLVSRQDLRRAVIRARIEYSRR